MKYFLAVGLCHLMLWPNVLLADDQNRCQAQIIQAEKGQLLPKNLLQAIGLGESGKHHQGRFQSWPWTIHAQGEGKFFATKQEAIEEVYQLQAKGIKSIDVGCMQINLLHHPNAFSSVEEAFDPETNVHYAAGFLKRLFLQQGTWTQAVAHYHSAHEEFGKPYQKKIYDLWKALHLHGEGDLMVAKYAQSLAKFKWWRIVEFGKIKQSLSGQKMKGTSLFQSTKQQVTSAQEAKKSKRPSSAYHTFFPDHRPSTRSLKRENIKFFALPQKKRFHGLKTR